MTARQGLWAGVLAGVMTAVLVGCSPVLAPMPPSEPGVGPGAGPDLAIDVVNRSDADVTVTYEFEAQNAGGGGEGTVPGCERILMQFGDVAGRYRVEIDGQEVVATDLPPWAQRNGHVVVRVEISPDGTAAVEGEPMIVGRPPPMVMARVDGCPERGG